MGIVYRVCEVLLARLPVDDSGRRVFAETLADWRREPRTLRGLAAVVRAVAGVSLKEVASLSMCRTWLHILAWSTAWVILGLGLSWIVTGYSGLSIYRLAVWSVPGCAFFLPSAILLSSTNRHRRLPVLGLVLTSAVVGLALVGWIVPESNRVVFGAFVDPWAFERPQLTGAQQMFQAVWPPLPLDYLSGRYAHSLPGLVVDGPPSGWRGIQLISFTTAFVALSVLMPLVGAALSRSALWSRRLATVSILMFVLYQGRVADFVAPDWILWNFVAPWLPVVAITAVLIVRGTTPAEAKASASIP